MATLIYEMPEEGRFMAVLDESTGVCTITQAQLDDLIRKLNYYAEPNIGFWEEEIHEEDRWTRKRFVCSVCGHWQTYGKTDYCPHCGEKMEGEDGE